MKEQALFDKKWFRGEAEFVRGVKGTPRLKLMSGHAPKQTVERLLLKSKSLEENMEENVFALQVFRLFGKKIKLKVENEMCASVPKKN